MAQPDEQGFLSHLIELRQRLVRAAASIVIVFAVLSPFMREIFDLLSRPMMAALPQGTKLLATGVIAHFSSALVAGRLLGLDPEALVGAQGIAASTASGVNTSHKRPPRARSSATVRW